MIRRIFEGKKILLLILLVACLCLARSVGASERVEVYSATENGSIDVDQNSDDSAEDSHDSDELQVRSDIRLTGPDDAQERLAEEDAPKVKGAERLIEKSDGMSVPVKRGRSIASDPVTTAQPFSSENIPLSRQGSGYAEQNSQSLSPSLSAQRRSEEISPAIPENYERARRGVQEMSVIVSDLGFFPNKITVNQNIPVKIYLTASSKETMCFMLDQWGIKKGVTPGKVEEISFMPTTPGDYKIHCPIRSIQGVLTVKESQMFEPSRRGLATSEDLKAELMDIVVAPDARKTNEPKNAEKLRALIDE